MGSLQGLGDSITGILLTPSSPSVSVLGCFHTEGWNLEELVSLDHIEKVCQVSISKVFALCSICKMLWRWEFSEIRDIW